MSSSLPSRELLQLQADWLSEARARILRLAEIARRKSVLDLGAGYGIITQELRRRTSGTVVALDLSLDALFSLQPCVCATAMELPFRDQCFDMVFSQNLLLWIQHPKVVVQQVARVLSIGGTWVLFEADYGAMIEYPPDIESAPIWISALKRSGADPRIGRKLPLLLQEADFQITTELLPRLSKPGIERFNFLSELNLTAEEERHLEYVKRIILDLSPHGHISHLPYFMIIAERR